MFSSNTSFKLRNTTTATDVLYKTTKKDQSSISQSTVTTPLVSLTTSTFATKTSTTMIAITTKNSTPTLPATPVNPYYYKSQFPTISIINKTNSPQSFPKLSNSSSTSASHLSSTATTKTSPKLTSISSVNPFYTNAQFPTISPIGNKNDSVISIPKLLTSSSMSTSKPSSITTTNTPPKYLFTSVNPFKTKTQLPTILPFGNMTYSPQLFPRLSTSSPKFSFKLPSTKSFSISPIILSTSVHPTNRTTQFSTISPITKKTGSSQSFPKLSTSILRSDYKATSKQVLTPTEATKPTAAQIVTSIVDPNLKYVKVDLNSSAEVVHNFPRRRRPSTQITTPNHSKKILFPLTSKPLVLPVPSSIGNEKQQVKFLDPPPIVRFKSPNKSITTTAKSGPRYIKTYTLGTTFKLLATTVSPKSMRSATVRAPKSKNDVLHPKWKDLPVPPPLPPLEPKPEVVVPGSETIHRSQTTSSSQNPTTMLTSFSVKGWQWKSKYRQRGETNDILFTCVTSPHNIILLYY